MCAAHFPSIDIFFFIKLIAAAAIIGFSSGPPNRYKPPIATGIPQVLYPNSQKRFCLIFLIVFLLNWIAVANSKGEKWCIRKEIYLLLIKQRLRTISQSVLYEIVLIPAFGGDRQNLYMLMIQWFYYC